MRPARSEGELSASAQDCQMYRCSTLPKNGVEVGEHIRRVPLLEADEFAGDLAMAVDDVRLRIHRGAVLLSDSRVILFGGGIAISQEDHALVAQEFFVCSGVFVGGDAEDNAVARLDVFL